MAALPEENKMEIDNDYDPKNADKMFEKYLQRFQTFEQNITSFPIETNSIFQEKVAKQKVYQHMTQTYPICHGGVLSLCHRFLLLKREYGSKIERELYGKMSIIDLFDRIARKRAIVFYQKYDSFMLRNGKRAAGGWEQVGTEFESVDQQYGGSGSTPLLKDYMSYDELLLSALCGVSSPTHFINDGNRYNNGRFDHKSGNYPLEGIYMGLIGARFEKPYFMEYALMIITEDQNKAARGYGGSYKKEKDANLNRLQKAIDDEYFMKQVAISKDKQPKKPIIRNVFESFYSRDYLPLYDEVEKMYDNDGDEPIDDQQMAQIQARFFKNERRYGQHKPFLDTEMFKRRIRISLELFIFDSDKRAKQRKQKAFCHLVGLGSGYWAFHKIHQDTEIVKVALSIIADSVLSNISCIYFSWFDDECEELEELKREKNEFYEKDKAGNIIKLQFGKRNPADKLDGEFKHNLICACFAWDSNSFVGNEYWLGRDMLSASGDPAAAACSTIPFLQNSEINREYVNGKNTMLYFFDQESGKYEFIKLKDINLKDKKEKEKWLKKSVLSIPYKRNTLTANNNNYNSNNKKNDNDDQKSKK